MGLLSKFGTMKVPTTKKEMSWDEIVDKNIEDQVRMFNGEELRSTKKNKEGEYPLRPSWYKPNKSVVVITITNFPLLPSGEGIPCSSKSQYGEILEGMKNWRSDSEIKPLIDKVKTKYDERLKTLRSTK